MGGDDQHLIRYRAIIMSGAAQRILGVVSSGAAVVGLGATLVTQCLFNVDGGERGIIYDYRSGILNTVYGEGTHFMVPILQKPIIFDVKSNFRNITTNTGSKDLQDVQITLRLLHRPIISQLPTIYDKIGVHYDEVVLPGIGKEVLKAIVAQFNAEELITQREVVSERCRDALVKRAKEFGIVFDDISITHLSFSQAFERSVERKQVALVEAERARYVVEKVEQEKRASVIRAEGDSEAGIMVSKALKENGQGLIELRKIEASRDIAGTLARSRNVAYLPTGNNLLLNIQ